MSYVPQDSGLDFEVSLLGGQLKSKLTSDILNKLQIIQMTSGGKFKSQIHGLLSLSNLREVLVEEYNVFLKKSEETELFNLMKEYISQKRREDLENSQNTEDGLSAIFGELVPIVDLTTAQLGFFHPLARKLVNVNPDVYLSRAVNLSSKKELLATALGGVMGFFPLVTEAMFKANSELGEIWNFNIYNTPKWVDMAGQSSKNLPERLKALIENVFPEESSREYVYSWMYHAFMDRNHVYLCMVGPRGVGKTMIADLVGKLVGVSYYQKADDSMLEDKFNSQLENARVVLYDEINVTDVNKINKLKRFANDTTALQSKGKDTKTIRNYSSGILANNYIDGLQIGPEERRFSIVEIGKKDLRDLLPREELDLMAQYLNDPDDTNPHQDIVDFGHWLLERYAGIGPPYSNNYTWRGEYFYMVSFSGLTQWKQFLLEFLLENYSQKTFLLKEVKIEYKKAMGDPKAIFPSSKTISNFLYDYRHRDKLKVGEVSKEVDDQYKLSAAIVLTPEFIAFAENSSGGIKKLKRSEPMPDLDMSDVTEDDGILDEDELL